MGVKGYLGHTVQCRDFIISASILRGEHHQSALITYGPSTKLDRLQLCPHDGTSPRPERELQPCEVALILSLQF